MGKVLAFINQKGGVGKTTSAVNVGLSLAVSEIKTLIVDLMDKLITSSAEKSSTRKDGKYKVSHRVIIDHLRSSSFLIADGILPSNEGRGYVLRRIMRRGMRHAHILGCKDPLLCKLVPNLIEEMGDAFPELIENRSPLFLKIFSVEHLHFKFTFLFV